MNANVATEQLTVLSFNCRQCTHLVAGSSCRCTVGIECYGISWLVLCTSKHHLARISPPLLQVEYQIELAEWLVVSGSEGEDKDCTAEALLLAAAGTLMDVKAAEGADQGCGPHRHGRGCRIGA